MDKKLSDEQREQERELNEKVSKKLAGIRDTFDKAGKAIEKSDAVRKLAKLS